MPEEQVLFKENQKFRKWWVMLLIFIMNGFLWILFFYQVVLKHPIGADNMSDASLIIALAINEIITVMFFIVRLETVVTASKISVRFFPFHRKPINTKIENIKAIFIREYKPIKEYGGWGIKGSSANRAYNISGNIGLQLILHDNTKILVGTNNPSEVDAAISSLPNYLKIKSGNEEY
ncbi:MAG: DUF6141 family protein [Bacteroidota bacterium]|jgi:hypothetical protein